MREGRGGRVPGKGWREGAGWPGSDWPRSWKWGEGEVGKGTGGKEKAKLWGVVGRGKGVVSKTKKIQTQSLGLRRGYLDGARRGGAFGWSPWPAQTCQVEAPRRGRRTQRRAACAPHSLTSPRCGSGCGDAFRTVKPAPWVQGGGGRMQRPGEVTWPPPPTPPVCYPQRLGHQWGIGNQRGKETQTKAETRQPLSGALNLLPGSEIRTETSSPPCPFKQSGREEITVPRA